MIDQRRGGGSLEGHFYERKLALLAKEDQIETEFEKMVLRPYNQVCGTSGNL